MAQEVQSLRHTLPDGMQLELLHLPATVSSPTTSSSPPLLFIHGSYHGAWCWAVKFMPYLAAAGFNCYAGKRGVGGTWAAQENND